MPPGVVQSIKDHITKPTAMARGRVAHLIEWKGWRAQRSGWEPSPAEDEHYCCLPDELREARFAAGQRLGAGGHGDGTVGSLVLRGPRVTTWAVSRQGKKKKCQGVDGASGGRSDHRGLDGQPAHCRVPMRPGTEALPPSSALSLLS